MSGLLNRLGSKSVKFDLELTIHYLKLEKKSPCLIKIRAKRGKKNQQETQSIQYYPNLKQIQFSQILNFECTLLKKNEKYLKKDIQFKVLEIQGKSESSLGSLTIELNSLAGKNTSINFQEFQLKDSKDAKGILCLSLSLFEQHSKKEQKKGGKNSSLNTVRRAFSVDEADSMMIREELESEGVKEEEEERKEVAAGIRGKEREDKGRRGSVQSLRKAFCVPDNEVEEIVSGEFEGKNLKKKKFATIRGDLADFEGLEENDKSKVLRFGVQGLSKVVLDSNLKNSEELENEARAEIKVFENLPLNNEENQVNESFEKVEDNELNISLSKAEVIENESAKSKSSSHSKSQKESVREESFNSNKSFEVLQDDCKIERKNSKKSINSSNSIKISESGSENKRKNSNLSLNSTENNFLVENKGRKYSIQSIESNKSANNEKSVSIKSVDDSSSSDSESDNKDIAMIQHSAKLNSSTYSETEQLIYAIPKDEENISVIISNQTEEQSIHKKEDIVYIQGEILDCADNFLDPPLTETAFESVRPDSKSVSSSSSIDLDIGVEVSGIAHEYAFESSIDTIKTHETQIELPEENIIASTKKEELTEKVDDYKDRQIINEQYSIEDYLETPDKESELLLKKERDSQLSEENIIENPSICIQNEPLSVETSSNKTSSNKSSSIKSSSIKSSSIKSSSKQSSSESSKSHEKSEKNELSLQVSNEGSNEDLFDKEFVDSSSSNEETSGDIQIPVTNLKEVTPNSASQEILLNLKEKESGLPESRNTTCCGSCRMF